MIRWLVLAFFALLAQPAASQSVTVRSGEHDGFTRLVLYLPRNATWMLDEGERRAVVRTDPRRTFDIATVYDRIDRARFAGISQLPDGSGLELRFGCDCVLRSQSLVGDVLVLDLADAPPAPAMAANRSDTRPPVVRPRAEQASIPIARARDLTEQLTRSIPETRSTDDRRNAARLAALEQEVLENVARAASQGLLIPDRGQLRPETNTERPLEIPVADPPRPVPEARHAGADILTHTATLSDPDHRDPATSDGHACIRDRDLAIETWRGEAGFAQGLGQLRAALTGETDRVATPAALNMARFYLSYGFGAEAAGAVALIDEPGPEALLLGSMARILEKGSDPAPGPLTHQQDCDTDAALWGTLAQDRFDPTRPPDLAAITRSMNKLPTELRHYLGPILADRFLTAGNPGAAQSILRNVDRAGGTQEYRQSLAEGRLDLATGKTETGRATLEDAVRQGSEVSPEALIALVDQSLSNGDPVPQETAELVAAYAVQFRKSPLAVDLMRVEILARAASGQFDAAYDTLERRGSEGLDRLAVRQLFDQVSAELARSASGVDFLRHALSMPQDALSGLTAQTGNEMAARALDLGFPELAEGFLAEGADGSEGRDRRLLRARVALATGRPHRAEADLLGLAGTDADELRALAQSATGKHAAAQVTYAAMERPAVAEREAWLAGQWTDLAASEDALSASVGTLMATQGAAPMVEGQGDLARNRSLLQNSTATRATLEKLLGRYQVSVADGS